MPMGLFFPAVIFPLTLLPLLIFFLQQYRGSTHKTFSRPKNNKSRPIRPIAPGEKTSIKTIIYILTFRAKPAMLVPV
jgi:hypothetical protein